MNEISSEFIDVSLLRIGMYVYIDLGWISHPFPLNQFKIRTQEQIDTICALGIRRIRFDLQKSDPPEVGGGQAADGKNGSGAAKALAAESPLPQTQPTEPLPLAAQGETQEAAVLRQRQELLARQRSSLKVCEKEFTEATKTYRQAVEMVHSRPDVARERAETTIRGAVQRLLGDEEVCIRLLSEQVGERTSQHSVNVTVISLLLARACGLPAEDLIEIGVGALLHDIGKIDLPARLRWQDDHFSLAELQLYQEHVAYGVAIGKKMGLSAGALLVIGQHHEFTDGSGYPKHTRGERMSKAAHIVSLVNYYDSLCNPNNPAQALTPHEALSQIFAQTKTRFETAILATFIRMMGVYPPGSVVQLSDARYALVVSVNSSRPLKPRVIIHEPSVPKDSALVVDLEHVPELGIRRSLKPVQLPQAAVNYLSPRPRACYFFERARDLDGEGEPA